ncbi:MAG TPA: bifunctional nuclease family protein [Spirochaetota bacterium]|nr:bifunctional nuclease family protein [Spirochaetota bacterium]HNT11709.1 bifunctional nuclease family protein [Spirochaetota bacterium]HNV48398.1 bifunctional nuclease family protein [Spirochaetota bacterium]HOS40377.1 bifunctional nuclease family protein [Spirochaetota bacterium]
MSLCKVDIVNIFIDQETNAPVILLQDAETKDVLPIMIAPLEASLIAIELEGKKPVRPLTHDLMANLLRELSFEVESVVIDDLKNNIYYASIHLVSGARSLEIDSRPSDAIALALRTKSPIYVKKKVFALCMGLDKAAHESDKETLKQVLEDMEIDDAGGKIM